MTKHKLQRKNQQKCQRLELIKNTDGKVVFHMKVYKGFYGDKILISNPANGMGQFFNSEEDENGNMIFNETKALKEMCENAYPHLTPDDIHVVQIINLF